MVPNTFMFMLRWQFVPLILGLSALALSAYNLLTFQGDPPNAPYSSLSGMVGRPVAWIGLALGLFLVARAWYKASQLRHGR